MIENLRKYPSVCAPLQKIFVKSIYSMTLYSEKNTLTEFLLKSRGGNVLKFPHCEGHTGNYGILLPRFYRKNSVKSTFY